MSLAFFLHQYFCEIHPCCMQQQLFFFLIAKQYSIVCVQHHLPSLVFMGILVFIYQFLAFINEAAVNILKCFFLWIHAFISRRGVAGLCGRHTISNSRYCQFSKMFVPIFTFTSNIREFQLTLTLGNRGWCQFLKYQPFWLNVVSRYNFHLHCLWC